MLRSYPQFSEQFVLYELPMARGWAYYADSMEHDAWLGFCGVQRAGPGYIKQHKDWLIKNARINQT